MSLDRLRRIVRLRLRSLAFGAAADRELDDELRYHLDRQIEANLNRGMTPDEARTAALVAIGGVEQRKEQMRDARGASRGRILSMVLRDVGRILIAGVVVGCLLALAAGRGVRSLLFGLDSSDAVTLAAAVVLLAAAGLLSAAWPALRALRIDPMSVLREN